MAEGKAKKDIIAAERSKSVQKGEKGGKDGVGRKSRPTQRSDGDGSEKVANLSNRHSECSASETPVSLHPTPERKKKKKKKRKKRSKSLSETVSGTESQIEGNVVSKSPGSENVEGKAEEEKRKGCKDCLMENCTGAVTLYRWLLTCL